MKINARILLALIGLTAGMLAAVAGAPQRPLGDDEISAIDLARAIRDRQPRLLVIDLRPVDAVETERLPTARALGELELQRLDSAAQLVVYADRDVDPDVIEAVRSQHGARSIRRLRGGVQAWKAEVLFPILRSDAVESQQGEFRKRAQLSRYFGGSPRVIEPGEALERSRSRRGC